MTARKMQAGFGVMLAALAGAGLAAEAPQEIVERRIDLNPAPRGAALLRDAMLAGHNRARAAVGEPPLTWDPALARDAAGYAAELAQTGRFAHSPTPRGNPRQGENLWMGTRGAFRLDEMVGHWVSERDVFKRGRSPDNAVTGKFGDVGHYTQIVWRGTTQFGCAIAASKAEDYLVCRYLPAGNVVGVDPLAR